MGLPSSINDPVRREYRNLFNRLCWRDDTKIGRARSREDEHNRYRSACVKTVDMASRIMERERRKMEDSLHEDMRWWRMMLRSMPAVRMDKVAATREALRHNAYDDEHILAETAARLSGDLDALCSRELEEG